MVLEVFFDLMSQPSRAVILFLKMNNIPFVPKPVALRKGEHFTDAYAKINPFKKVPVIIHDGFKLTESVAILRYLSREMNVAEHWYPKDNKGQARVDQYLEWQHLDTRLGCSMYFQSKFLQPILTNKPANPERVARFQVNMEKSLDLIEDIWLNGKSYLSGDKISIADLIGVCELEQPKMAGYDVREGRPRIAEWMKRVRNDLQPHYDEAHKIINHISEKFGGNPPENPSKL